MSSLSSNPYSHSMWSQDRIPSISVMGSALDDIAQYVGAKAGPLYVTTEINEGWGVLVSIDGIQFDYQLTGSDLEKVFSRYGSLRGVEIFPPYYSQGRVWFVTQKDAENAIVDLNNKVLAGVHGRLSVVWDESSVDRLQTLQTDSPSKGLNNNAVRKFTCRFDIGIENDKDFRVAQKIIGQKGNNMKRIVDSTGAKLRLRGKGSGYLEGPTRMESPEPLHLCVSCTNYSGYMQAIRLVTDILEGIYGDYQARYGQKIRVQMIEVPLMSDDPQSPEPGDWRY